MTDRVERAYRRSLDLLRRAATPHGFVASPDDPHYAVIWGRDALISSLGALRSGDEELVAAAAATLDTLARHATSLGQVPALVAPERDEWDFGEGGAVDVSAWFPIVVGAFLDATGDIDRVRGWWDAAVSAVRWLAHQDVTGSGLVSVAPSTDWMDAALTRSGRTLHVNALTAWAHVSLARIADRLGVPAPVDPSRLVSAVNHWFWPDPSIDPATLYPHGFAHDASRVAYWEAASRTRRHYVSHIVHAAFVDRCDVLANVVAVLGGVTDRQRAEVVLDRLEDEADPFPTRSLSEPVTPGDPGAMLVIAAEAAIPPRWRNRPGRYHNGAVWPYIGGLHVAAVATVLGTDRARPLLEALAEANALGGWGFHEWIDLAGNPEGAAQQTWNAGTFVLAWSVCGSSL